jgi:dihydroorotate dehydrogenase electron transfer subunit
MSDRINYGSVDKASPNSPLISVEAGQGSTSVMAQREIAPPYFQLTLRHPRVARTARAGQFVHILPRTGDVADPLLRRAFSVARIEGDDFDVIYRAGGRGTKAMSRWRSGDIVDVIGPLGRAFAPLGDFSLLVGGGVGVPPLALLSAQRDNVRQRIVALIGARSSADVLCTDEFSQSAAPYEIATEDGSAGHRGLVTDLLRAHLENPASHTKFTAGEARQQSTLQVFACGPVPMLRAVASLCAQFHVPCQVSLEEAMPCGVGICNGCVVPTLTAVDDGKAAEEYSRYRRLCIDGPMLWANEVDWERLTGTISP